MTQLDRKQLASGEGAAITAVLPRATSKPLNKRIDLRRWMCPADIADGCQKTAVEAMMEVMESTCDPEAALKAGNEAFRLSMPKLTSRLNVRAYIACIDVGARGGWLSDREVLNMVRCSVAAIQGFGRHVKGREVPQ